MHIQSIADAIQALNRIKITGYRISALIRFCRSLILAVMTIALWSLIRPEDELTQLGLGLMALILSWAFPLDRWKKRYIEPRDFILGLEMNYGKEIKTPISTESLTETLPEGWLSAIEAEKNALIYFEKKRQSALASSLLLPISVSLLALSGGVPSFKTAISEVSGVVSRLARGASIRIVSGAVNGDSESQTYTLSEDKPPTIELLAENLVEIQVTDGSARNAPPVVFLRRLPPSPTTSINNNESVSSDEAKDSTTKDDLYQSFQLLAVRDAVSDGEALGRYRIAFAASESVRLFVPSFAGEKPLATLIVRQPPIPKVRMEVLGHVEDPWPDDQPLPLRIFVKAENPIQTVKLIIKSGQRVAKELVANVMAENKLELSTDYRLVLETYVENDLAQVEIIAEATDRSIPIPLIGLSEPIKLNTASAYGRYRETLGTLRSLKVAIDDLLGKGETQLPHETRQLATKATIQSEKSPFFDGIDRVQIYRFASSLEDHNETPSTEKLLELSGSLNDFLFEHEILDDRERDRDFFVAMRSLSRLIEQDPAKRPLSVSIVTERTRKFLNDRYSRWNKRIERLGPSGAPERWASIRDKKPFHQAMHSIDRLDSGSKPLAERTADMLTILSKTTVEYRTWIEELEAREDKFHEEEEKARQEGLANARDVLRELQQRQGEVSQGLDRADERPRGSFTSDWPTLRMKQNTNARDTKRLESQMRALSPSSAARIGGAFTAMSEALESGDREDFQVAETASDLAGRLLRQAESAAQDSQQKRRSRGRRRRVTGDSYYGQSVVGGDIEIRREYQVDRRYREDILDEVQNAEYDEDNRTLLESYLRHVVR